MAYVCVSYTATKKITRVIALTGVVLSETEEPLLTGRRA